MPDDLHDLATGVRVLDTARPGIVAEVPSMSAATPITPPPRSQSGGLVRLRRRRRRPWWIVFLVVAVALGVGGFLYMKKHHAPPPQKYLTARVRRGDLRETIRATGTVQPVLQVQVGAQVSGRISNVLVDFNSHVHHGDLIAEIDATPYRAQVSQARAALLAARAQLAQNRANLVLAERNLVRAQDLRQRGLNAPADLDSAVGTRDAARAAVDVAAAQVSQAEASLQSAETNLAYTRIYAPIDGVVSTRSVDPGQTVAASFQTPTLFVIANDLTHMRVIADVDEANVGKLREGMAAVARVDAFPRDTFNGVVHQLRIGPTTTNGVVTYPTVIDIENPESKLRPGMTATITVVTQERLSVLEVPNAALRYVPSPPSGSGHTPADAGAAANPAPDDSPMVTGQGAIYIVRRGQAVRVPVTVGISDGIVTEVGSDALHPNDEVVLDETDATGAPRNMPRMRMF